MTFDSGITHTDVRRELGTLDSQAVSEAMIQQQIDHAEIVVGDMAPSDAGTGTKRFAVTVLAAKRTLDNNVETFEETFEAIDLRTTDDVAARRAAIAERVRMALGTLRRSRSRSVRRVTPGAARRASEGRSTNGRRSEWP